LLGGSEEHPESEQIRMRRYSRRNQTRQGSIEESLCVDGLSDLTDEKYDT